MLHEELQRSDAAGQQHFVVDAEPGQARVGSLTEDQQRLQDEQYVGVHGP